MAYLSDSLGAAIRAVSRLNPFARFGATTALQGVFSHQIAFAAYMSSGMLRKVIAIPADDRVREWRDWQADKDAIAKIEAEERRLQLQAKTKAAEILRGIGGGALILITAGDHAQPLNPETIREGGLVAINVVSRWQITGKDWVEDLADPLYGTPRMFSISGAKGQQDIHPSRVVAFRGEPIPSGGAIGMDEAYWGDSRLLRVFTEVQRSDETQAWFSALVKKAKVLRIGIPNLTDMVATQDGKEKLAARVALIAEGENSLNATVYAAAGGQDQPGETITDYQITWAGIPAVMDAFDQRVAAVADIPFTRLMGRSPAGMNATGDHDTDNWNKMVASGQKLETRPCLEQIDPVLLRSAGAANPDDITWRFAPLDTPTEKEEADTFNVSMDAIVKLQNTGTIPAEALSKGVQNWLEEREYLPGLGAALAEIPEDERFGLEPDDDGVDPSALAAKGGDPDLASGGAPSGPARRAANDAATWLTDATPRPLYVQRKLLSADALIAWAKANGFDTTLPASDMHVTVLYSRAEVDPMKMGRDWREDEKGQLIVRPGGPRVIERLGENAVVLRFASPDLEWRHRDMVEAGGSHDWPEYAPHVTLSYAVPDGVDLDALKPFNGELRFGPEIFEALDLDWKSKITEDGGAPTGDHPFVDGKRSRRRGLKGNGKSRGSWSEAQHPRGPGGRFTNSGKVSAHVERAMAERNSHERTSLGKVSGKNADAVLSKTGVDIAGHERVLESSDIRHVLKSHGSAAREAARGQAPIERADFERIPQIVERAHSIRAIGAPGSRKLQRLEYTAQIGGHEYQYLEEIRPNAQIVALKSMRKK